jgi:hypothetical protein
VAALTLVPVLHAVLRTVVGVVSRRESARLDQVTDELASLAERSPERPSPPG